MMALGKSSTLYHSLFLEQRCAIEEVSITVVYIKPTCNTWMRINSVLSFSLSLLWWLRYNIWFPLNNKIGLAGDLGLRTGLLVETSPSTSNAIVWGTSIWEETWHKMLHLPINANYLLKKKKNTAIITSKWTRVVSPVLVCPRSHLLLKCYKKIPQLYAFISLFIYKQLVFLELFLNIFQYYATGWYMAMFLY